MLEHIEEFLVILTPPIAPVASRRYSTGKLVSINSKVDVNLIGLVHVSGSMEQSGGELVIKTPNKLDRHTKRSFSAPLCLLRSIRGHADAIILLQAL